MSSKDTRNPCTGLCRFDAEGACRGCRRTKAEVKGWKRLSDPDKTAINRRIRAQTAAKGPDAKERDAKGRDKRLRKLDRKIGKLAARLDALRAERAALTGAAPGTSGPRPAP
ncbi:DUF1289 domain-containing protein [Azospirillum agricola]|uniref:DUF1289 domain-containing protein n=1 Tax=Azospirillum agricola TaxID=1720247 RepID=UPI000A0F044D|nr:DUF1289 domain-containing protein [Azospirillum agricola]SMH33140.1 hypothetical protein SAMN02982994_0597 [Azospirillum lipoferum]